MRQIHIPWCTLTQTIRDISTLAWAGIVKKLPVLSSREFMLLMYDALSQISSVYKFPSLVVRQSGTQIRILTAHISSVYKNTSLGSRGTPFIIYTPVYELPILCYISSPDIKEI